MAPRSPKLFPPLAKLTISSQSGRDVTVSTVGTAPGGTGSRRHPSSTSTIASWTLYWGDGDSISGSDQPPTTLTHTYAADIASAIVHLVVVDVNTRRAEATLTLAFAGPTATLTVSPVSLVLGVDVTGVTLGTAAGLVALATWSLAWGDATDSGTGAPPVSVTHRYGAVGTYAPRLTVTDVDGFTATATTSVTVTTSGSVDVGPATHMVAAGDDLQAVLDQAAPGDLIVLASGATFTGHFRCPVKSFAKYITVRSDGALPPVGTRIGLADIGPCAKLRSPDALPVLDFAPSASYWSLEGLDAATAPAADSAYVIAIGDGDVGQTQLSQVPHHINVDRCYIHGDATTGCRRGIALHGAFVNIRESYIGDCKEVGGDSQAIAGWNGPGPYVIDNNYLEGAGENILFGGAIMRIPNCTPSDILITRNTINKPVSWKGGPYTVKNLIEIKHGQRITISGNIIEHTWDAGQQHAIVFTPRADSVEPWVVVQDIIFEHNIVKHIGSAFNMLGENNDFSEYLPGRFGGHTQQTKRITIQHNLFYDLSIASWGPQAGQFVQLAQTPGLRGVDSLTVDHNTVIYPDQGHTFFYGDGEVANPNAVITSNIFLPTQYNLFAAGGVEGSAMLAIYFPGATVTQNVFTGAPVSGYPANNDYPATIGAIGFVNYAGGDYQLSGGSPYLGRGVDFSLLPTDV